MHPTRRTGGFVLEGRFSEVSPANLRVYGHGDTAQLVFIRGFPEPTRRWGPSSWTARRRSGASWTSRATFSERSPASPWSTRFRRGTPSLPWEPSRSCAQESPVFRLAIPPAPWTGQPVLLEFAVEGAARGFSAGDYHAPRLLSGA